MKLKILFVSEYDLENPSLRSGVHYFMYKELKKIKEIELLTLAPVTIKRKLIDKIVGKTKAFLFNKILNEQKGKYIVNFSRQYLEAYSQELEKFLLNNNVDYIFSPDPQPVSYYTGNVPFLIWMDATIEANIGYYPEFSKLHQITINDLLNKDRNAISNSYKMIYASHWALESGKKAFKIPDEKLEIIPRGANLPYELNKEEVYDYIALKSQENKIKILFICSNWERKGGKRVINVINELAKLTQNYEFTIIGEIPEKTDLPDNTVLKGYLNKDNPTDKETFKKTLLENHFLLVPSIAENFGNVYAEASAHGTFSLAINTGGISGVIKQDINGHLFDLNEPNSQIAKYVYNTFNKKENMKKYFQGSREHYEKHLNWESNIKKLLDIIYSSKS